jgi:putative ABC transport system ATP-binding protein
MLLEIKGLTKEYIRNDAPFPAVRDVFLDIEQGGFVSITGRSGSGKTTLLSMAAGLIKPTSGSVEFEGRNIAELNDAELSALRNTKIGYIPQGLTLLPNLNVLDNVRLPYFLSDAGPQGENDSVEKALSLLARTGIPHLAASYPKELSGGEARRVSIARALINDPAILIADEPTGDLDAETTADIMALFDSIAKSGTAILLVTHESDAISGRAQAWVMNSGKLSAVA